MLTAAKDMELGSGAGAFQGQIHDDAVLRVADRVVGRMDKHHRRSIGGDASDVDVGRQFIFVLGLQVARITGHGKVRPAARFIGIIDRLVEPLAKVRGGGDGQLTTCRKADDADAPRINPPLSAAGADEADRALSIEQRA